MLRGTNCLIVDDNGGKILAIKCSKNRGMILPGGKVEKGETWKEGAARELLEETGLKALDLRYLFGMPNQDELYPDFFHVCTFLPKVERNDVYKVVGKDFGSGEVMMVTWRQLFESEFKSFYECMRDAWELNHYYTKVCQNYAWGKHELMAINPYRERG